MSFAGTTVEVRVVITNDGSRNVLNIERVTDEITDGEMNALYAAVPDALIDQLPVGSLLVTVSERFGYTTTSNLPPTAFRVLNGLTRALSVGMMTIYRRLRP